MSKLNRGFNQTALNGSIGAVTYVTRKGVTIAKQKVPAKSSARKTLAVMNQRMKWSNFVRMWQKLNTVGWHPSFMNKAGLQTDYNMFMRANLSGGSIAYLTKPVVDAGGVVVTRAVLTQGTLPSVGGELTNGNAFVSDISMGGQTIGASTTVSAFSKAIVDHNPDWLNHDQLTIVEMKQSYDESTGIPRATVYIDQIYLDIEDEMTLLSQLVDITALGIVDGKLAMPGPVTRAGVAMIHSRGDGSAFAVSSQELVVNNDLLATFQSETMLTAAIESYGGLTLSDFLVPEPSDNDI